MKKIIYILMIMFMITPVSTYAMDDVDNEMGIRVELEACIDGDTARFKMENDEIIKARFLAIDTPETVHPTIKEEKFGKEASDYTCETLTNAKEIRIEYDENSDEEDKYGRKLVWVFTDDILLQELLVSKGYAEVAYLYDDYKYTSILQESETLAKENKLGIWSINEAEEEEEENVKEKELEENNSSTKKQKNFLEQLKNNLLGAITSFIDNLLESILKSIEDML